ncbi:MAG: Fe-S cluster assembly sulfur transfer protein SufU [Gammaproteobacteria bacterium]
MMDLKDLYRDVIVDHNRSPRNFRRLEAADRRAQGFNPLCGDKLEVYLRMNGDRIEDIAFEGSGCAISVASASLMTEKLKGRTEAEARELFDEVHALLTRGADEAELADLGKLAALGGVRDYPSRVKCATLSWHTVTAALDNVEQVSTE